MTVTDDELSEDRDDAGASAPSRLSRRRRKAPRRGVRRSLSERITASMLISLALALLTFVVIAAVLRDRREMTTALVPAERIAPGVEVTEAMVDVVEYPASVSFADDLLDAEDLTAGLVAGRTLPPGEPLTRSAVGSADAVRLGRVMSIPIQSWGDVGGELQVGDEIDVIDTREEPRYVVQTAAVIERASGDGGGGLTGGTDRLWISIEVTGDEALAVAAVVQADEFIVVRSTGATPVETVTTPTVASTAPPVSLVPSSVPEGP